MCLRCVVLVQAQSNSRAALISLIESLIQFTPSFAVMDMQGDDPTNEWIVPITAAIRNSLSSSKLRAKDSPGCVVCSRAAL